MVKIVFLFFVTILEIWSLSPRFKQSLKRVYSNLVIPDDFSPDISFKPHRSNISHSIFTVAIGNYSKLYVKDFFGTLRKVGYDGDVVLAITPQINQEFLNTVRKYDPILYQFSNCHEKSQGTSTKTEIFCSFRKKDEIQHISVNMVRYLFYQWWASQYSENTVILLSDFRDVIFQSNPFLYMPEIWYPPVAQLTLFLEPLPQKVNAASSHSFHTHPLTSDDLSLHLQFWMDSKLLWEQIVRTNQNESCELFWNCFGK
jgi:hypothetical protein